MAVVPWTYNNPRVDRRSLETQSFTFCGRTLQVLQNTSVEIDLHQNTAFKLWDGAYLLSRHLENRMYFPEGYWQGKRCVELGAGCALVSQVAWMLGGDVTATDLADPLIHSQNCIAHTVSMFAKSNDTHTTKTCSPDPVNIRTTPYAWGDHPVLDLSPPYDFIFASDVVYQAALVKQLCCGIEHLSDSSTTVLLTYKARNLGEDIFFPILKHKGWHFNEISSEYHPSEFCGSQYKIFHMTRREK